MKALYKFVYLIVVALSVSCSSDDAIEVKASFKHEPNDIIIGESVSFLNNSLGINEETSYLWDFGDGNTSSEKNPVHIYQEFGNGAYEVTLTIKDAGSESTFTEEISVSFSDDIEGRKTLLEKLSDGLILTCAHRANINSLPENSIASISKCIEKGVEMVEIDIRETVDGELILMHDPTIDRTANGIGNVGSYALDQIKGYKLLDQNGELTEEKIPGLKEVLSIARGKIYIDLDISGKAPFEKVYPIVKQYGMLKQVLFYSSTPSQTMFSLDTDVIAMPIIYSDARFKKYETNSSVKVVHYTEETFNHEFINKAKEKGWYIFVNAYVNSSTTPEDDNYNQIDKVSGLHGNIIQTDHPILVKSHLKN